MRRFTRSDGLADWESSGIPAKVASSVVSAEDEGRPRRLKLLSLAARDSLEALTSGALLGVGPQHPDYKAALEREYKRQREADGE